jgi:hypothetical protein
MSSITPLCNATVGSSDNPTFMRVFSLKTFPEGFFSLEFHGYVKQTPQNFGMPPPCWFSCPWLENAEALADIGEHRHGAVSDFVGGGLGLVVYPCLCQNYPWNTWMCYRYLVHTRSRAGMILSYRFSCSLETWKFIPRGKNAFALVGWSFGCRV